jgi:hypothetical protein
MSSVVISGDTSGAITLSAPAVAGTNTATLPAATGTVMVSGNMPAFSAYMGTLGTTQSVTSTTWTKVALIAKEFDTANCFDSTTNYRFTPNVAGYYQFTASVETSIGAATRFQCGIYKNGALYKKGYDQNATNVTNCTVAALVYLNGSTDYVELYGYIVGSSPTFYSGAGITSFLQGVLVRAA